MIDRATDRILEGTEVALRFDRPGDFASVNAAEKWLRESSFAVGAMQRDQPRGLLYDPDDEWAVAKWRNMTEGERYRCDGYLVFPDGDCRNGRAVILLRPGIASRVGAPMEAC